MIKKTLCITLFLCAVFSTAQNSHKLQLDTLLNTLESENKDRK
jgi:hypothetical protein